jgi:hypothetical protein
VDLGWTDHQVWNLLGVYGTRESPDPLNDPGATFGHSKPRGLMMKQFFFFFFFMPKPSWFFFGGQLWLQREMDTLDECLEI